MRKRLWLAVTSSVITLVVVGTFVEVYLQHREPNGDGGVPLFTTHNGIKISPQVGLVSLSLAPFTVYKNRPSSVADYFVNSRGLRAEEGAERAPDPKILLLGGSAAFGLGVPANQDTIAYLLESGVGSCKVLNAGVVGFLSGQELTYLVTEGVDYRPALVVAYDGWNDLFDGTYQPRTRAELGVNSNFFGIEKELVENYQSLGSSHKSFARFLTATYRKSRVLSRLVNHFQPLQSSPSLIADSSMLALVLDVYTNNIQKMERISRAFDAQFIVVFQAELGQKLHRTSGEQQALERGIGGTNNYSREFPNLYKQFIALAKERFTKEHIQWIDANEDPRIRDTVDELFGDVVHTNRKGNEAVAAMLNDWLRQSTKGLARSQN